MEIQISKLRGLLELMKPVISKKSTIPATTYISVGNGKAVATDLETMVIADLPEATEPMLLPFASLADMLKYVPGDETLKIEAQKKKVSLVWSGGTASYPTEAVQDFPVLPDMPTKAEGLIDGDTLLAAMVAALPYTATESSRPVLNGVTLVLGSPIEVAAGDGYRMSHQVLGLSFPLEVKVIVPAHAVAILGHVFAKTPRTPPTNVDSLIPIITAKRQLHMALMGDSKLRVDFGTTASVIINLVAGSPPDFLKLIPKGEPVLQSQVFAPQLEAAVKRVRDIAKDGTGIVRMVFADGHLTISARADDQKISATMDALNTQGEPGRIALNYSQLLEYLAGKQGIIILSKYTDTGPIVFQYQKSPRVLIMPMQNVVWGDEKPPAAEKAEAEPEATETSSETPEKNPEVGPEEETESSLEQEETAKAEQEAGEEPPDSQDKVPATNGKKRRKKATA